MCYQVGAHGQHQEVANTHAGFRQLVRCGGATSLYVLEATGPYYLAVAYHLAAAGAQVESIKKCGAMEPITYGRVCAD